MLGEYVRQVGVIKQGQTSQLGQRLKESELGKGGEEGFGLVVQGVFNMISCCHAYWSGAWTPVLIFYIRFPPTNYNQNDMQ